MSQPEQLQADEMQADQLIADERVDIDKMGDSPALGEGATGDMAPPRLVVPEGLLIEDMVRARLERRLAQLPSEVDGVAAELDELPPGVSCRVHAEWRSLEPAAATESLHLGMSRVQGAVLLRAGVPFAVNGDSVDVPGASLLSDAGAVVHDAHRPVGTLRVASRLGRPPFPRRPVVVLLGLEPDARVAEWARRLANGLLRREVEARLAVPAPPEGLHLARPCAPCAESITALAPDAIIALDRAAAGRASQWCGDDRSAVVVELSEEIAGATELVSWQIDRAEGRLRARIGRTVDPVAVAALLFRLCAGPHPIAPRNRVESSAKRAAAQRDSTPTRQRTAALLLSGEPDRDATVRQAGFVDHCTAEGMRMAVAPLDDGIPHGARSVPLLLLSSAAGVEGIDELIAHRRAAGRATVLDVTARDLARRDRGSSAPALLDPQVASLAAACTMVSAPAGAPHVAAADLGVRTFVLPTILSRTYASALRNAWRPLDHDAPLVVGWRLDVGEHPAPDYADAVVEALLKALSDDTDVRLHLVADAARLPGRLRRHEKVSFSSDSPEPETIASWALHLFTPQIVGDLVADDLRRYYEAGLAGVPSVLPAAARRAIEGHPSPQLVVRDQRDPRGWLAALRSALGDEKRRAKRSEETMRHSVSLSGYAASRGLVNRFNGWALHRSDR